MCINVIVIDQFKQGHQVDNTIIIFDQSNNNKKVQRKLAKMSSYG